jgi:hypothetical protein
MTKVALESTSMSCVDVEVSVGAQPRDGRNLEPVPCRRAGVGSDGDVDVSSTMVVDGVVDLNDKGGARVHVAVDVYVDVWSMSCSRTACTASTWRARSARIKSKRQR